jgi:hypothetical protein
VFVQSTETVVDQSLTIGGARFLSYPTSLEQGQTIHVNVQVRGGLNNALQTWLVDLSGFQLLKAGQQFSYWSGASPRVTNAANYLFTAPATNVYYVVLDNRANLFARNIAIHVDKDSNQPNQASGSIAAMYRARYAVLRKLFMFRDFNIYVRHCGVANAFSNTGNGDITICSEFIEETQRQGAPGAEVFAFLHEAAHSLLNLWDCPGWDNEDSADEFATVVLMLMNKQELALQAAQFWASEDSGAEEVRAKLLAFDRHSLSVQRARDIVNWLGRQNELERRWLHVMIPNMQTAVLAEMVRRANVTAPSNEMGLAVLDAMRAELQKRRHS